VGDASSDADAPHGAQHCLASEHGGLIGDGHVVAIEAQNRISGGGHIGRDFCGRGKRRKHYREGHNRQA
jgi:hypothetical protein